jgi:pimeloyl-ACP methyl ester carboxylesterase
MDTANQREPNLAIVFFSGAGLDNWIWEPLSTHLNVPVCPVDLPGRGSLAAVPTKSLSLDGYMSHLLPQLERFEPLKLVFVCHSLGSVLGLALAESLGERVHGIIHIASVVPRSGASFCSSLPFPANVILPLVLTLLGTRPPERAIRDTLCSGVPGTVADRVVSSFCPESKRLYRDRVAYSPRVTNLGYILTSRDKTIEPALQRQFAARAGIETVETLEAGHLVMLENPARLADTISKLLAAGNGQGGRNGTER